MNKEIYIVSAVRTAMGAWGGALKDFSATQLGAIAIWRNYLQNGNEAITKYKEALSLGYTKSIGEIYETAGIKFDFSEAWISELSHFVKEHISHTND
jgi:oligoendopeptidase F